MKQLKAKFSKGYVPIPYTLDICPKVYSYIYISLGIENPLENNTKTIKATFNKDILFVIDNTNKLLGIEIASENALSKVFFNQLKKGAKEEYEYFPVQVTAAKSKAKNMLKVNSK